jgi:hypothetical protein
MSEPPKPITRLAMPPVADVVPGPNRCGQVACALVALTWMVTFVVLGWAMMFPDLPVRRILIPAAWVGFPVLNFAGIVLGTVGLARARGRYVRTQDALGGVVLGGVGLVVWVFVAWLLMAVAGAMD